MRKLHIAATGGLGDQVCAEPVLRFMLSRWCASDDITLATHCPEVFAHLPLRTVAPGAPVDRSRLAAYTVAHRDENSEPIYNLVHPVDYIALRLLRRTLPLEERTIRIRVQDAARQRVRGRIAGLKRPILVHPGRSWQSKTVPADIWEGYCRAIIECDFTPVIIGKSVVIGEGDEARRDTVPLSVPGAIDLVGALSFAELIAIVGEVPALLSNDSLPIHVAGAFDGWIGLIATAKRPDAVLPHRHGSQAYKTCSLARLPLWEQFDFDPFKYEYVPPMYLPEDALRESAPKPEEVAVFAQRAYAT